MPRSRLSTLFSLFVSAGGIRLPFNGPGRGGGNVGKMVAVSIGTEQSKQGFVTTYNRLLAEFPYQTKAVGTGITYVFSDSTAQILEQQADTTPTERVTRSLKFGAVGAFWVGPLLAAWFQIMEKVVPGRTLRPVVTKLLADQLLQGPFMISTMFFWTSLSNGATLAEAREKIQQLLYPTWINSLYVWGPVQAMQQAVVPLQYRVLVANGVSYFWDTYLSLMMMDGADGVEAAVSPPELICAAP